MSINKSLKNAMLTGNGLVAWGNNAPGQYNDRQHQYFSAETRTFTQQMARYSSDYVQARVQGLDAQNPYSWQERTIRMADIVKPTAAIQRDFDDYKMILFADRDIEYIMQGAKIEAMGSIWIVYNPLNISGSDGAAVVRRCNAVWNFLDYYGNVVSEPILVENSRANANDSDTQQSLMIAKGYFNVLCQYNDHTRQIDTNTRMILGTAAYRVTGYSDFDMEYTGDYGSVRMLQFSIRFEEANFAIDDMVNHVAGGKAFSWGITVSAPDKLRVGATAQCTAESVRNGQNVVSSGENPISYYYTSSDKSVLTVTNDGTITAVAEGTATITATLTQNPAYSAAMELTVTETEDGVAFTSTIPQTLGAFESASITAAYFLDGEEQDDPLTWYVGGADETAYSYAVSTDGKSVSIDCFGYSKAPLIVTAAIGADSATANIALEGF